MYEGAENPEHEPIKENTPGKPAPGMVQTPSAAGNSTNSTATISDEELEQLRAEAESKRLEELEKTRDKLREITEETGHSADAQMSQTTHDPSSSSTNSEAEQDDQYYQSYGQ